MAPRSDTVLILTHRDDYYTVDRVAAEVAARGARAVRFDTDRFPTEVRLAARVGAGARPNAVVVGDERVTADEVRGVWLRHVWPPRFDGTDLDQRFVEGCVRESTATLEGFYDGFAGARWVNAPHADRRAADKLFQLRRAGAVGLTVPRTLVTNDADALRAFHQETGGDLVAKMLTRLTTSMEKNDFFVPTSAVRAEDLESAELLRYSPMMFQERIEKDVELRVVCVGARQFVGSIDTSRSAKGAMDWRIADVGEAHWEEGSLQSDVAAKLDAFMRDLDLVYGAVDLIRTPEGEHVFLEVNSNGEWGMLEHDLGLPIAAAIADELLADVKN